MSMDIAIWAACALSLPHDLPQQSKWSEEINGAWAYNNKTWAISYQQYENISPNEKVTKLLPNAKLLSSVSLQPLSAPEDGYKFLNSVTESVAKKCNGAVLEGPMGYVLLNKKGEEVNER